MLHRSASPPISDTPNANALVEDLRRRKFRITRVRRAIIELLCGASQPMSAPELLFALESKRIAANKTTVYRELDFLVTHEVAAEIDILDGAKRYEVAQAGNHHHHLVCTACGKIQCVAMEHDLDALERDIRRSFEFKVDSHILEFFGRCSACVS